MHNVCYGTILIPQSEQVWSVCYPCDCTDPSPPSSPEPLPGYAYAPTQTESSSFCFAAFGANPL